MLNQTGFELAPLNIIEVLKTNPKAMGLLRNFARSNGHSIEECFSGTPRKDKIALLNTKEINTLKNEGAFLIINKETSGRQVGQKITKILEAYLNE